MTIQKPLTRDELAKLKKQLDDISPWPWQWTRTAGGEYWITAPDDSDHEFRLDYEPIFESSGTIPQFATDAEFIAGAPLVIARLLSTIALLKTAMLAREVGDNA